MPIFPSTQAPLRPHPPFTTTCESRKLGELFRAPMLCLYLTYQTARQNKGTTKCVRDLQHWVNYPFNMLSRMLDYVKNTQEPSKCYKLLFFFLLNLFKALQSGAFCLPVLQNKVPFGPEADKLPTVCNSRANPNTAHLEHPPILKMRWTLNLHSDVLSHKRSLTNGIQQERTKGFTYFLSSRRMSLHIQCALQGKIWD